MNGLDHALRTIGLLTVLTLLHRLAHTVGVRPTDRTPTNTTPTTNTKEAPIYGCCG